MIPSCPSNCAGWVVMIPSCPSNCAGWVVMIPSYPSKIAGWVVKLLLSFIIIKIINYYCHLLLSRLHKCGACYFDSL